MSEVIQTADCLDCPYRSLIFENLNAEQLIRVTENRKEILYKKGEVVCKQGDRVQSFLYLKTGLVKIFKENNDNKPQIISIAKPKDFIGLLSIFSQEVYPFSISCIEDSAICFVDLDVIRSLIREDGEFGLVFLEKMSEVSENIWQSRLELSKKNLRGRIAYTLLEFSQNIFDDLQFDLPISRKELAELIDMTTENVIRILSEFRKDEIIGISGKTITILDNNRLEQINLHG